MRPIAFATWVTIALSSCGGSAGAPAQGPASASASASAVVVNTISISFTRDPDQLPFDPHAARLQAATAQLTAIAGHPIAFRFDAALLPQWRYSFEMALTEAVENVARDLDALKARQADVFAFADRVLTAVECRYVAVPVDDAVVLDPTAGVLRIALTSEASSFAGEGWLFQAAQQAYWSDQQQRFSALEPEQAPDASSYARFLMSPRRREKNDAERAQTIWRLTRVFPRLSAKEQSDADSWLAKKADFFGGRIGAEPQDAVFGKAKSAWTAWLSARIDALGEEDRIQVARVFFARTRDRHEGDPYYRHDLFPGFDFIGYGLRVMDQWVAAGRPMRREDHPDGFRTFLYFVCPSPRDRNGEHSSFFACEHELYRYALETPDGKKRLMDYLLARRDPALIEAALMNVIRMGDSYTTTIALWRSLEADPALWSLASRVIAEQVKAVANFDSLVDEAQRQWRALPRHRGEILYMLSRIEDEHYGLIPWKDFARLFGAAPNEADFALFLDQSDHAFWNAHLVWDTLSPGWSRAAVLVPRLDGYLDRTREAGATPQAMDALNRVLSRMCNARDANDMAAIHAWILKREGSHASERSDLEPVDFRTRPATCKDI